MNSLICAATLAVGAISGEMVNVLDLGVKNDGSEDISEIVNKATSEHALFFPGGIYRVDKPLHLKNTIRGAGYCRSPKKSSADTWFVSSIECGDKSVGVINYVDGCRLNVENLNIECHSQECGIYANGNRSPMTLIDRVGIYNVSGCGISIGCKGTRPVFIQNVTIFGASGHTTPSVGIYCHNYSTDNRMMNIEIMGCQKSLDLYECLTYGSNLHLWTGCMGGKDVSGKWWRDTRAVVLHGKNAMFSASNIYPDTSFYCFEQADEGCSFHIQNVNYWEDESTVNSPDFDGEFFHCSGNFKGNLQIDGGFIPVFWKNKINGRMKSVYMAGQKIRNVTLRTNRPVNAENFEVLNLCDMLPDYTIEYTEKGFCKVADVFTLQETGYVEAKVSTDNGACFLMTVTKKKGGKAEVKFTPQNDMCEGVTLHAIEPSDGVLSIYLRKEDASPLTIRFTTFVMSRNFRPIDYGCVRGLYYAARAHEVKETLQEK